MTDQEYLNDLKAQVYEGSFTINLADAKTLLHAIGNARHDQPQTFDLFNEVFLKLSAIETELEQRLNSKYARERAEQQLIELRREYAESQSQREGVARAERRLPAAQRRLQAAQKRLAEAQENAA